MLLLALSTSHKVGLALAVAGFAGFALIVSMVIPRWWPQFPGRGLTVFLIAIVIMFLAMVSAVEFLGREPSEAKAEEGATTGATVPSRTTGTTQTTGTTKAGGEGGTVQVSEVEYKIKLPKDTLAAGTYTFVVHNDGKFPHDLVVKGSGANEKTPLLDAGQSKSLKVDLKPGTYDLYCSVPGHKQLGMDVKLTVN